MTSGPFETLAEARNSSRQGYLGGSDALVLACAEVGVRLGRFDGRVLEELGRLDSDTVWVIASIIRRAGGSS